MQLVLHCGWLRSPSCKSTASQISIESVDSSTTTFTPFVISDGEGQRLEPATIQVFSQGRPPTAPVTLPNVGVPNRATAADPAGRLLNSVPNVEELDREHAASQLLVIDHVDHVVLEDPGQEGLDSLDDRRSARTSQSMRSRQSRRSPQTSRIVLHVLVRKVYGPTEIWLMLRRAICR